MKAKQYACLWIVLLCLWAGVIGPVPSYASGKTLEPVTERVAGLFYRSNGPLAKHCVLVLKGDGTYFAESDVVGDVGGSSGTNGIWTASQSQLFLKPSSGDVPGTQVGSRGRREYDFLGTSWMVLQWGERVYLVPKDDLRGFAQEINDGSEPRQRPTGAYFLREGDWRRPSGSLTDLPVGIRKRLLNGVVVGRVLRYIEIGFPECKRLKVRHRVLLEVRRGRDIPQGTRLWPCEDDSFYFVVEKASRRRVLALVYRRDSFLRATYELPKVDSLVSSQRRVVTTVKRYFENSPRYLQREQMRLRRESLGQDSRQKAAKEAAKLRDAMTRRCNERRELHRLKRKVGVRVKARD